MKKVSKHFLIVFLFYLVFELFLFSATSHARVRKYTLNGLIALSYSSRWASQAEAETEFVHAYRFALKSYIRDPRFIRYDLETTFAQNIRNTSETITTYGFSLGVNFLEGAPHLSSGPLSYIPKPIRTRFSYYSSGDQTMMSYGISLAYSRPERFRLFHKGKLIYMIDPRAEALNQQNFQNNNGNILNNGENINNLSNNEAALRDSRNRGLPFPEFYLDYDRSQFTSNDRESTFGVLDFRSQMFLENFIWRFQYRHESREEEGFSSSNNIINFDADYNSYDVKTRRSFTSFNRLSYFSGDSYNAGGSSGNSNSQLFFRNATSWSSPIGTNNFDRIGLSGGFGYAKTSISSYNTYFSPVYTKRLSPILTDTLGIYVTYNSSDTEKTHTERVMNVLDYDASRFFRLGNSLYIGNTTDGVEYGGDISISTKTRIPVFAGYGISVGSSPAGRIMTHMFSVSASGPVANRLTFSANARYEIKDVPVFDTITKQETLHIYGNLYYPFVRSHLVLGANYQKWKTSGGSTDSNLQTITLSASYFRVITSRVMFSMNGSWVQSEPGSKLISLGPRLTMAYRQVSINIEYEYSQDLEVSENSAHKIYMNVSRNFGMRF